MLDIAAKQRKPSAGSRIVNSLKEAVDWVEGKDIAVRVSQVNVPMIDVRATRRRLGLSQTAFASNFDFQPATIRNREEGRTRPDGPRTRIVYGDRTTPEAVADALRKAS